MYSHTVYVDTKHDEVYNNLKADLLFDLTWPWGINCLGHLWIPGVQIDRIILKICFSQAWQWNLIEFDKLLLPIETLPVFQVIFCGCTLYMYYSISKEDAIIMQNKCECNINLVSFESFNKFSMFVLLRNYDSGACRIA